MQSEFIAYCVCGASKPPGNLQLTNVHVNSFDALVNQEHRNSIGSESGGNELFCLLITQPFAKCWVSI